MGVARNRSLSEPLESIGDEEHLRAREEEEEEERRRHQGALMARRASGEVHGIVGPCHHSCDLVDLRDDLAPPPCAQAESHPQALRDVEMAAPPAGSPGGCTTDEPCWKPADAATDQSGAAGAGGSSEGAGAGVLEEVLPEKQLTLEFRDLCGWVPTMLQPPSLLQRLAGRVAHPRNGKQPERRQIMFNLGGQICPGQLLALMGPSGSGKTSLLSVIGGRAPRRIELTGSVSTNGAPITKAVRRRIGFVLQDDVLYEDLTVHETLLYAALLRLPRAWTRAQKAHRVESIIDALGLRKSRGTIIGGFMRRGISGGERKRVSIGHELLVNPAVLMLDEPTSGLDSTTAMHLLTQLEELAAGGRAVCTTIHQPSSRLYQKLDRLMLLAEGHCMYYGPAQSVLDWFGTFCYSIPFGVSIPDYILDLAMGEAGYSCSGRTGAAAVAELYSAFEGHLATHPAGFDPAQLPAGRKGAAARTAAALPPSAAVGGGVDTMPRTDAAAVINGSAAAPPVSAAANRGARHGRQALLSHAGDGAVSFMTGGMMNHAAAEEQGGVGRTQREGSGWMEQVRVLTARAIKVRRFEQLTAEHFIQLFAVAFISGLLWWQAGASYLLPAAQDVLGNLFFLMLFPSFRALFHALFTYPSEQRQIMKERPGGLYRLSAYYVARTAADVPIELLNTFLFTLIVYWFAGLKRTAGAFVANLCSMLLITLVAEAWGLLIGAVAMNPKVAQTITTVIMLTFMLVGGYYVRNMPVWIGWLKYLSFVYWGFNLLLKIQFRDAQYYSCGSDAGDMSQAQAAAMPGCNPVPSIQDALGLPTNPSDPAYPEVLVLLAMLLALRTAVYFVLNAKTRVRTALMGSGAAPK